MSIRLCISDILCRQLQLTDRMLSDANGFSHSFLG